MNFNYDEYTIVETDDKKGYYMAHVLSPAKGFTILKDRIGNDIMSAQKEVCRLIDIAEIKYKAELAACLAAEVMFRNTKNVKE